MSGPFRRRNRRNDNLRKDYRAHIPILVASGLWKGRQVTLEPRSPDGQDHRPWVIWANDRGVTTELRFTSEEVVSKAWPEDTA